MPAKPEPARDDSEVYDDFECDVCGGGNCPQDACLDDDDSAWTEATDVCKFGGPAPCIDDICHALNGCMHHEGGS